jgi:hypothetical protein
VQRLGQELFQKCFADYHFLKGVDTLDINSDSKVDFVFNLESDDYSVLMLILSDKQSDRYSTYELGEVSSVELYAPNYELKENEIHKDFTIIGTKQSPYILTNTISSGNTLRTITKFSDTIYLDRFMSGKILKR